MSKQSIRFGIPVLFSGIAVIAAGCGRPAARLNLPPAQPLVRVSRTAIERQHLIRPGRFGENGAADVRRVFFDSWNEQIIRADKDVGTVFMGDSITELWDLHVYFTPGLGELIENRGISGDLASVMARRFEADVVQLRPRNVVILGGINDLNYFAGKGKSADEIFDQTMAALDSMMDAGKAAGINVLVCSILPTNDDFRGHSLNPGLRARINERLKADCQAKGCVYVDYGAAMQDADGNLRKDLARDGLHPHWAGYEIMARVLKRAAKVNGLRL